MGHYTLYAPLTDDDRANLQKTAGNRWRAAKKRFVMTAVLPLVIILPMLLIVNLVILANLDEADADKNIIVPEGIENFSLLWMAVPVFGILVLVNLIMFLRTIPPVYLDLKRGVKRQYIFMPKPYTIPQSTGYYIHTDLPALRFIEVSYEQYMGMDYSTPCFLEMAPLTGIPLGIKTVDDPGMLPTDDKQLEG